MRKNEFTKSGSNPATKFLEWKSDQKCLSFYNKDTGKNQIVELPFKFLTLKEMHTVKGWDDSSQSGIYSNEVPHIGKEPIEVKSFKGGVIAKGIYRDIKSVITARGAIYHKSVYVMTENGEIVNLSLKGSGVQAWGDFTQKTGRRLPDEWVIIKSAEEKQKGKIKYSTPVFEFESSLSQEQSDQADQAYDTIIEYLDGYIAAKTSIDGSNGSRKRPVVDIGSPTFEKIDKRMGDDPSLTVGKVLDHYDLTERAVEALGGNDLLF